MAGQNKTVPKNTSVEKFLNSIENSHRRSDAFELLEFMSRVTGMKPRMWGESIIGYGQYHYNYKNGGKGTSCLIGFSPRKANLTIYVGSKCLQNKGRLAKLGKHKHTVSCLHINRISDVNMDVLEAIVQESVKQTQEEYPDWESAVAEFSD